MLTPCPGSKHSFDVLRFIPALTISEEEMQTACDIFESALKEVYEDVKEL
jgi:4-aminobutyrate aminotransferase-like enzyme